MEKTVRKFRPFKEAENADYEYYRALSRNEKSTTAAELQHAREPRYGTVDRSARFHPLTEHEQC